MTSTSAKPAYSSGVIRLGDRDVRRLGYGAMRITGEGQFGRPPDHDAAIAVLRRAVELGVNFIDTAEMYGPFVSEELICEALHPYGDVFVATKGGLVRTGSGHGQWHPNGRPAFLREQVEGSLNRLGKERIDLYQLHRIDPKVPVEESVGALKELADEGKIDLIGLSEVSLAEIKAAETVAPIASVQNRYNVADRRWDDVLDYCDSQGKAFIPWFPVGTGDLSPAGNALVELAGELKVSPIQLALAWLLRRSPAVVPIPGTRTVAHVEENIAAAEITLTEEQYKTLTDTA